MRASCATWRTWARVSGIELAYRGHPPPLLPDQFQELLLVEDVQLQLLRLLQLRAGARPGDHVVRFGAHGRRRLAAELAHQRLRVGPPHRLHRPRENERLARERPFAGGFGRLRLHAGLQQSPHQLSPMAVEVLPHLARHVGADALHGVDLLLSRRLQLLDAPELHREQVRRRLAHLRDAQCIKEAAEARALAVREPHQQLLRRLLGEPFELNDLLLGEPVEVARVRDPLALDELVDGGVAEAVDVHRTAAREMAQPLESLRAAERVDASMRDVRLLAHHLSPTHRALGGHAPALLGLFHADDLGYDVARAMDDDARAHIDALLVDLRLVVHGHVANRHTANHHRVHVRDRGEYARAADIAGDLLNGRLRLFRRVLERDRPARRARDEPELELLIETIDLDHHAVDLVVELVALALPLGVVLEDVVDTGQPAPVLVDAKAHPFEPAQHVPLRTARAARIERVHERLQVAAPRDAGIDLADAAGGRVARIHIAGLALRLHLGVKALEGRDREIDLASHLEDVGQARKRLDAERDAANRADVGGHVLADGAVTARGRADQPAVLIREADREAVDLQLRAVVDVAADGAAHAAVEGSDLVLVERVLEAEHRRAMANVRELLRRLAAHALRRRVGGDELRVLLFQAPQLQEKGVELGV